MQLQTRDKYPGLLFVLKEDDPRASADTAVVAQVTSGPPDNHLWHYVDGTDEVVPRSELVESHKFIEITDDASAG